MKLWNILMVYYFGSDAFFTDILNLRRIQKTTINSHQKSLFHMI